MSMNLRAVATLDAKPFIASLNELSAATARLQGTVAGAGKAASKNMTTLAAGSRGAVDATEAEIAARQALGKEYQRVNKTSQKTSRASRRSMAVSYTHLTLPTIAAECRSRWSPYH